ncbi:unnamed protein product [Arctia plantaginis]|uniref:Insulin-like domain-containing protein n=1 Tax=Arctia plantaginis TaxID=874455 RepID=A0A8S1AG69_ARCPL|nr:unnamed protein product [Arctia plantaginis]
MKRWSLSAVITFDPDPPREQYHHEVCPDIILIFVFTCVSCDHSHVYCGRRLSHVLAAICWDVEPMKRDAGWVFSPIDARALDSYRGKRGPVDECCYKPCTNDELRAYC